MEMILCILLLMKGCMFCKYTPATLKNKALSRPFPKGKGHQRTIPPVEKLSFKQTFFSQASFFYIKNYNFQLYSALRYFVLSPPLGDRGLI